MIRFILNGQESSPLNREDIRYSIDFGDARRVDQFSINVSDLIFVGNDRQRIFDYKESYGAKAGMPLDIIFSNGRVQSYYLKLDASRYTPTQISCPVIAVLNTNDFFLNADGLSFRLVDFKDSDFKDVPYVIISREQPLYYISLIGITITIAIELVRAIKDLADIIGQTNEATVPAVGVSLAGPVLSSQIGSIISLTVKIIAQTAYIIALVLALKNNIQELFNLVLPKIRTFKGITYKTLLKKAIESNRMGGYTLQSNILDKIGDNLVILPTPQRPINSSIQGIFNELLRPLSLAYTNGYPDFGDVGSTLGASIDEFCEIYNCQVIVNNGIVRIDPESEINETNTDLIRLAYNNQSDKESEIYYKDEYSQRRIFAWQKDVSDLNTYDNAFGTRAELGYELIVNPTPNINTFTDVDVINSNYSLGTRKDVFSVAEKAFLRLAKIVDSVANTSLAQQIENRIGVLQISDQYFQNTKLLWMQGSRIPTNHREKLSSISILRDYHDRPEVKEVVENMPILLNESQFFEFINKKNVTLSNDQEVELLSLEWDEINNLAELSYQSKSKFDKNIRENTLNDGRF